MSYVIREAQEPLDNAVYDDFMEEMVACAPLSGQTYDNDRRLVHQYLMGFITDIPSEDYVRKTYTRGVKNSIEYDLLLDRSVIQRY